MIIFIKFKFNTCNSNFFL